MRSYVIVFPASDQPKSFIRFDAGDDEAALSIARALSGDREDTELWDGERLVQTGCGPSPRRTRGKSASG